MVKFDVKHYVQKLCIVKTIESQSSQKTKSNSKTIGTVESRVKTVDPSKKKTNVLYKILK